MKNLFSYLFLFLSFISMAGCTSPDQSTDLPVQHTDLFYNLNHNDYPLLHLPLVKPIEAKRVDGRSLWRVFLPDGPSVRLPNRQDIFYYDYNIEELSKFAVKDGIIMAYSAYVDKDADAYIQDNYYHWFVIVPEQEITKGFHTEDEFRQFIQTLGIQDPDWQVPDDAYEQFKQTGCLEWIPNCK